MKSLAIATGLVLLLAASAAAAERVSSSTLERMGLGRMAQLSDTGGMAVRGKGPYDSRFFSFAPRTSAGFPTFRGPSMNYNPSFPGNSTMGGNLPSGMGGGNLPTGGFNLGSFFGPQGT
jgi:hypothetical protein